MIKIIHKNCGGQYGWFLKDTATPHERARAKDVQRMDGTKPDDDSPLKDLCPSCHQYIRHITELTRQP